MGSVPLSRPIEILMASRLNYLAQSKIESALLGLLLDKRLQDQNALQMQLIGLNQSYQPWNLLSTTAQQIHGNNTEIKETADAPALKEKLPIRKITRGRKATFTL